MATPPPTRRFKVEPVETSSKSSRRFAPQPVETTTKSTRKFAPEPVETTTKSHKRFAPQPVETTVSSNRRKPDDEESPPDDGYHTLDTSASTKWSSKTRGKFTPQPVESTKWSNRKASSPTSENGAENGAGDATRNGTGSSDSSQSKARRKFSPQLIETAKRTRKTGDVGPALLPSDKTEVTPGAKTNTLSRNLGVAINGVPNPPANTPFGTIGTIPPTGPPSAGAEARRLGIPMSLRRSSLSSQRSHSFRVPDLEPIESSESEESNPPSLSTSPSLSSHDSSMYKHATRMRESVDDRVSGYLLQLAAKAAEKQLHEQAMAAFPNSDWHEGVDHFIDRDDDEETSRGDRDDSFDRRDSAYTRINWELLAMQKHQEKQEQERKEEQDRKHAASTRGRQRSGDGPKAEPWRAFPSAVDIKSVVGGWQKDKEMDQMRSGARPPMLGNDITFPRCRSPEPARFDVTQGSMNVRTQMCYLTAQAEDDHEGLWEKKEPGDRITLWSNPGSRPTSSGGLWEGFCKREHDDEERERGPSGLLTPRIEIGNPFASPPPTPARKKTDPPTPVRIDPDMASIEGKLLLQQTIEEEFADDFVTQVYNYLSLGYPSIARDYDYELSKISCIPVSQLREDDLLADKKGYIRLGADSTGKDVEEESCSRWRALRVYVREWAKQQPLFVATNEKALGGFGVAVRKGSWAI